LQKTARLQAFFYPVLLQITGQPVADRTEKKQTDRIPMTKRNWETPENGNDAQAATDGGTDMDSTLRAAEFLRALANPHRLMLLRLLCERSRTVMELCEELKLRQSMVSQHLARLRLDGVVKAERRGHFVVYSLSDERARALIQTLSRMFSNSAPRSNGYAPRNGESHHGHGPSAPARP
jgi:DNA-binding transcriptional ArsR family regulator